MSENLSNFLADLGSDADLLARVTANPDAELAGTELTAEERAAILSRDPREVGRVLGLRNGDHKKNGEHKKKRPARRRPARRKPAAPKRKKR